MTPAEKMADANKQYTLWREKIMNQTHKMIYCPECGSHMWHDFNIIQRHMLTHHIKGRSINQDIGWKVTPTNL